MAGLAVGFLLDAIWNTGRQVTEAMGEDIAKKISRIESVEQDLNNKTYYFNAITVGGIALSIIGVLSASLLLLIGGGFAFVARINLEQDLKKQVALLTNLVKESLKDECIVKGG